VPSAVVSSRRCRRAGPWPRVEVLRQVRAAGSRCAGAVVDRTRSEADVINIRW